MNTKRISWIDGSQVPWRSLDQFSLLWGLSRAKAGLAIQALVAGGRMEVRTTARSDTAYAEYRIVNR